VNKKLMPLIVLSFGIGNLVCEARPKPVKDYVFSVTGVVKTEDDAPLKDANVTLGVNEPVYKATTPVKTITVKTDNLGLFFFMYMSHKRRLKYNISVQKEGFETLTVNGSSPPTANHVIRLKKSGSTGTPPRNE